MKRNLVFLTVVGNRLFFQLPNGEVQVYFANEGPYTHSNEQEISMMTSVDNGKTWGGYKTVCFRAGSRDGMPVRVGGWQ